MKQTKIIIITIVLFAFALLVKAQKLTLNDVLNKIEQNNPRLQSYQNKITAANELVNGAGAWMPPMASVVCLSIYLLCFQNYIDIVILKHFLIQLKQKLKEIT